MAGPLLALLAAGCADGAGSSGKTGIDMQDGRYGHTATALPDGRVVVIGGVERRNLGASVGVTNDVEIYDPTLREFSRLRSDAAFQRAFHAAAFSDGGTPADPTDDYILFGGGLDADPAQPSQLRASMYRLSTFTFALERAPNLPAPATDLAAVTLLDGRVAFIGGRKEDFDAADDITIYAPDGRSISRAARMNAVTGRDSARYNHRAVMVPVGAAGSIFVTGGRSEDEMHGHGVFYDVAADSGFEFPLARERQMHTLTYLDNGTPADLTDDVIVETGGLDDLEEELDDIFDAGEGSLRSVDLYRVSGGQVTIAPQASFLPERVFFHAAATAAGGKAVIAAGGFETIFVNDHGIYQPGHFIASNPERRGAVFTWNAAAGTLSARSFSLRRARAMNAATSLPDGTALFSGGINDDLNSVKGAEIVTP